MRFLAALLFCVITAFAVGACLTFSVNPEIKFWRKVVQHREAEIKQIRQQSPGTPIIFFTGGSSCAFSIDPAFIEKACGFPSINVGLPVSAEARFLLHQALVQTRPGDFLVICLEPDLLTYYTEEGTPSSFGLAMSVMEGHPKEASGGETFGIRPSFRDYLNYSRPGPQYLSTLIAKACVGRGYRYTLKDLRYRGHIETSFVDPAMAPVGPSPATHLSKDGRKLLETFKRVSENRGVTLFYSMPWHYTLSENLAGNRENKRKVLADINTIIPAIDDGFAGAMDERQLFADTGLHLSAEGVAIRSQALASALKEYIHPHPSSQYEDTSH